MHSLKCISVVFRDEQFLLAVDILRQGGIVAFPTETVYGLGARYDSEQAIAKIFAVKGRPSDNPLIVHISDYCQLSEITLAVPSLAEQLMQVFWPGPLTIVLPKSSAVPYAATGGLETVAVRMPAHAVALSLISALGIPLVAPSANLSGKPSPTTAQHVRDDFGETIDAIVDGGETEVGLESTVVSIGVCGVTILRPGAVTREMIETAIGVPVLTQQAEPHMPPPSPGMKYMHYAPRAEVLLFKGQAVTDMPQQVLLLRNTGGVVAVIGYEDTLAQVAETAMKMTFGKRGRADLAAHNLYAYFRQADQAGVTHICVEEIAAIGLGAAVMNRLSKAATRVIGG